MALMNNNSIAINNYLQNQMSPNERAAFEEQLAADKELQYELQVQRQIIKAAEYAGLKLEFARAIRQKIIIRNTITWGIIIIISIAIILLYNFRDRIFSDKLTIAKQDTAKIQQETNSNQPFINPPLQAINVPFSEYSFEAEKGDTIFHSSGSIIYFPPFALVDHSGNTISGMVKITYREFADPIDFFVSGIPMEYDSAGRKYNFESSGMCEINAYKDDIAVFVNPKAKPQINLSGKNKSPLHSVYFLDTITRSWKYNGKDIITEVKNVVGKKVVSVNTASFENSGIPTKPLKPMMASDDRQLFNVQIDPDSFEELLVYDGLRFEVVDESTYRPSDANEHWDDVKLERSNTEGIYNIIFTNARRKVSYKVRPVLKDADYAAALKVFNEKNKAYEEALKNRLVQDQWKSDSISLKNKQLQEKWNADRAWNEKMNELIIVRNKKLKEFQQAQKEQQLLWEKSQELARAQQLLFEKNQEKYVKDISLSAEIMRTFTINNFGIWNCDHPQYPNNEIPLFVNYTDSLNNTFSLYSVAVVYKGFNGITQFSPSANIRVIPISENMIWSIMDGSFYYFTYKDFTEARISRESKTFTFRMRQSMKKVSSYSEIRELIEKL